MKLCLNNNDLDVIENDGSGPKVWEHGLHDTEFHNNRFVSNGTYVVESLQLWIYSKFIFVYLELYLNTAFKDSYMLSFMMCNVIVPISASCHIQ